MQIGCMLTKTLFSLYCCSTSIHPLSEHPHLFKATLLLGALTIFTQQPFYSDITLREESSTVLRD